MGDEAFRELSQVDPKADQLLDEVSLFVLTEDADAHNVCSCWFPPVRWKTGCSLDQWKDRPQSQKTTD